MIPDWDTLSAISLGALLVLATCLAAVIMLDARRRARMTSDQRARADAEQTRENTIW